MLLHVMAWLLSIGLSTVHPAFAAMPNMDTIPDTTLLRLSEALLLNVKTDDSTQAIEAELAALDMPRLINGLNNDDAKKTFWINIYNAWFQILATREQKKAPQIFTKRYIPIAGSRFSLDDIEHGILRRYRWKFSKGYFANPFTRRNIRQLAVQKIDYRIHFTLNCGAKSCPPIAFYTYDNLNRQLNIAAKSFLGSETEIDTLARRLHVTKIMSWFSHDFRGKKGIRRIITQTLGKDVSGYRIRFRPYDRSEALRKFEDLKAEE